MSIQAGTSKFIFGIVDDKPALPPGFSFIEDPKQFLRATRNFGVSTFFVTRTGLVPERQVRRRDVRRTHGALKLGRTFADMNPRHKIRF